MCAHERKTERFQLRPNILFVYFTGVTNVIIKIKNIPLKPKDTNATLLDSISEHYNYID